jgi:hypothetical protein
MQKGDPGLFRFKREYKSRAVQIVGTALDEPRKVVLDLLIDNAIVKGTEPCLTFAGKVL